MGHLHMEVLAVHTVVQPLAHLFMEAVAELEAPGLHLLLAHQDLADLEAQAQIPHRPQPAPSLAVAAEGLGLAHLLALAGLVNFVFGG